MRSLINKILARRFISKRLLILALLVVTFVGAATSAFVPMRQKSAPKTWAVESPDKNYRLMFRGTTGTPSWPFTKSVDLKNLKVTVDVTKNGLTVVKQVLLYEGDAYDSSFDELYPDYEWLSNSALHLWHKRGSRNGLVATSAITITNESGQLLKYLYVRAGKTNIFLVFDIPAKSEISLPVALEHWEEVIGCEGNFDDHDLPFRSANFSLSPVSYKARYYVVIEKFGCSIRRDD